MAVNILNCRRKTLPYIRTTDRQHMLLELSLCPLHGSDSGCEEPKLTSLWFCCTEHQQVGDVWRAATVNNLMIDNL